MIQEIQPYLDKIFNKQQSILQKDWNFIDEIQSKTKDLQLILEKETVAVPTVLKKRIENELFALGPIEILLEDEEITEILVNDHCSIFYEKNGRLQKHEDHFYNELSYNQCLERLAQSCNTYLNSEKPFIEIQKNNLRITIIFAELSRGVSLLSIRKQPKEKWSLNRLIQNDWCRQSDLDTLKNILENRKNFLVIGGTGSGKTSLLQACINEIGCNQNTERLVIIEDTQELSPIYESNISLLTRPGNLNAQISEVTMADLLRRALRLRPDRLAIGEIRGAEATSLLMALATGHSGSFGSLHANTAQEALLRLEMLIQMGAPQWSLQSIRRLIGLTIQNIIVVEKKNGRRCLEGIYECTSVEDFGITLMKVNP